MSNIKDRMAKLVFDFKLANYRQLNEDQTKLSFLNPFWELLGWEVRNPLQVQVEKGDKNQQGRRPDYRFLKGNKTVFFVEAKKPAEDLTNPKHIYQAKLYCWNGKVPVAILTDFEEFRPFRTIAKPTINDAKKGIIKEYDMLYEEYPDRIDDLLNIFGREAVLAGSLDELVQPTKMELRETVDKHFLNTLSKWRIELATLIAKKNSFENEFALAEATQRILDRLVFLRILQDREIENDDFIKKITGHKVGDAYTAFVEIAKSLAPKYNGLIFNPHSLSENISIDTGLFKNIVKELDPDTSPYRFDEIPVEVLGTIYEQFLGDEIIFGKRGKVEIDQKPEVRKAGGVYYTPQYIVDYIVENTVGKLLGSGVGDRGSDVGNEDNNNFDINKENSNEQNKNISGFGSVAGGDEPGRDDISANTGISQSGDIRIDEPDEESGSVNSVEHSRRASALSHEGIPTVPVSSQRVVGGVGNSSDNSLSAEFNQSAKERGDLENATNSRQTSQRTDSLTPKSDPRHPKPGANSLISDTRPPAPDTRKLTPKEVSKIKILDPACGSGSFLLGAFSALIKWYEKYFEEHPLEVVEKVGKTHYVLAYLDSADRMKLTARMKAKILQDNIYGVDLDLQATEVAQMSLYIKVLEGMANEPTAVLGFQDALLPKMENNIKCGNSLIASDFVSDDFFGLSDRERRKINPFDWEQAFPFIKETGGFDAVIGNPPYLRVQGLQEYHSNIIPYLKDKYYSASTGNFDIYVIFIEKGFKLLSSSGLFGLIVPHKFFPAQFADNIRELLTNNKAIKEIVHFGSNKVFEQADTYTCLLFLSKDKNNEFHLIEFDSVQDLESTFQKVRTNKQANHNNVKSGIITHPEKSKDKWSFNVGTTGTLLEKLKNSPFPRLKDISEKVFVGLQTSADKIYVLKVKDNNYLDYSNTDKFKLFSQSLNEEIEIEKGLIKPFLMGRDVYRYDNPLFRNYVIFPYLIENGKAILMSQEYIRNRFPLGWHYFLENRKELESREKGKFLNTWWQLGRTQNLTEFDVNKILIRELGDKPNMFYDTNNFYHTAKIYSLILKDKTDFNYMYILGLLNTKLLNFFIKNTSEIWGTSHKFKTQFLNPFPIVDNVDIKTKEKLVELVERMLHLHKQRQTATDFNRQHIEQYIARTDREIDQLVYSLYGLTDEEIKIVESGAGDR